MLAGLHILVLPLNIQPSSVPVRPSREQDAFIKAVDAFIKPVDAFTKTLEDKVPKVLAASIESKLRDR